MSKLLSVYIFSLLLSGCIISSNKQPVDNSEFDNISTPDQLTGTYKNLGDGGPKTFSASYLSMILWPNDISIEHSSIDTIVVTLNSKSSLMVEAISDRKTVKNDIFTEGVDFKIKDGAITLPRNVEAGALGGVLVGGAVSSNKIGIDKNGNGKLYHKGTGGGLAFLVAPLIVNETSEVKFHRTKK